MGIQDLFQQLAGIASGDPISIASAADDVSGGHIKRHFESSQAKLDAAQAEYAFDAIVAVQKMVAQHGSEQLVIREILRLIHADVEAVKKLVSKWEGEASPPPELQDIVAGARKIAAAFSSSTGPLRRMYIDALRGSYTPEVFTFGFGQQLLEALIKSKTLPGDLKRLETLGGGDAMDLSKFKNRDAPADYGDKLESYERLASGGFVDIVVNVNSSERTPLFITHRTQATSPHISITPTSQGRRLLIMMRAGRGE